MNVQNKIGTIVFVDKGWITSKYYYCDIYIQYSRILMQVNTQITPIHISSYKNSIYDTLFIKSLNFSLESIRNKQIFNITLENLLNSSLIKDEYTKYLNNEIYKHIPKHCTIFNWKPNTQYKHIPYNNDILNESTYKKYYAYNLT